MGAFQMSHTWIVCFFAVFIICSCSTKETSPPADIKPVTISDVTPVDLNDEAAVLKGINAQYMEWKGVKYELGGLSKSGVDGSGLVYLTYETKLGYTIPRSTELLVESGSKVSKDGLRAGDLVFFKTSPKVRHVGIYMSDDQFFHASTSKGVMVSELSNPYWKEAYWQSRRMNPK